jgi:hypothetical protein
MKELHVPGLKIRVPDGSAFAVETAPNMPKLHTLCCIVGKRGSGKMVCTINMINNLPIDRLFLISPSAHSNSGALDKLKKILSPEDTYSNVNDISILADIVSKVEAEAADFEQYHTKMKKWRTSHAKVHSDAPLFSIQDDDYITYDEGPPKHKWGGRRPVLVLFFDDIVGSQLMLGKGQREVARLCLIHRHLGQLKDPKTPGAIGLSMIFNVQAFRSNAGSLPPALRNNLTLLCLFKTSSSKELDDVYESISGDISLSQFQSVCASAWREPHDFLLIDFHPKSNHPSRFRRNFDTFLLP